MVRTHTILLSVLSLTSLALAQAPIAISFAEMYGRMTVRGIEMSELLTSADGQVVEMRGYMAPPLKAELSFFVLTKVPLAVCPFCDDAATWPADIVVVKMPDGQTVRSTAAPLRVVGRLELGVETDEETGFVSLVRIVAQRIEAL